MSSRKQTNYNRKSCDKNSSKEPSIGAKSDCNHSSDKSVSNPSKESQELDERHDRHECPTTTMTATNSQIPRYRGGRRRRRSNSQSHSDQASHSRVNTYCCTSSRTNGAMDSSECLIHGKRPPNETLLYQMLEDLDLSRSQVPNGIKALHRNHVCSKADKSRSVPTSNLGSVLTTPLSTPSTPTDSRRMSFNRNSLSQTSTPLRQSKSSLSMTSQMTRTSNQKTFAEYMPLCEVQSGLRKGDIVEGVLRINPRNYTDAYISAPASGRDIYVGGMIDRNRAFNGDKVAVHLTIPSTTESDECIQRTGRVVAITEAIHPRIAGGRLTHMKEKNQNWALFKPYDSRIPRMRIPINSCPKDFVHHSQHFTQSLFVAQLDEWKTTDHFPSGRLIKLLGNVGDIESESELLLIEHQIDFNDFPNEAYFGLPNIIDDEWTCDEDKWPIPADELNYRRDFRNECVFTIDPSTARDLDDALSIKRLSDDRFEVGVHIADVSYFLKEGMPLDSIARRRTTSVYLVQKVIPMLPKILCEKLCSLNAGEEKLTFSVVWIIDTNANILEEWFGRTIIKSCIKLSYELAQDMINDPNREWKDCEMPPIHDHWSYRQISESVNLLNGIAVKLRKCRFESGALKIDKLKLHFVLDKESGLPLGFSPYLYRDSNRLVEEFMLLANMAVAHQIYRLFNDKAFLRCHPSPAEDGLNDFQSFCKHNGFAVDTTSSLTLQCSLDAIVNNDENISRVVAHYLLKAMQAAQYVCVGVQSAAQSLHHYALHVPLYTHFTSPIRRYADVIVHRLLSASLSYREVIPDSVTDLHRLSQKCNEKKLSARLVSESSSRLFLNIFIKKMGKIETKGIVVQVFDHSFDVMILNCGVICRIYLDPLPLKRFTFRTSHGKNILILEWIDCTDSQRTEQQTISVCLIVNIQVSISEDESTKLNAILQHPSGQFFQNEIIRNAKN